MECIHVVYDNDCHEQVNYNIKTVNDSEVKQIIDSNYITYIYYNHKYNCFDKFKFGFEIQGKNYVIKMKSPYLKIINNNYLIDNGGFFISSGDVLYEKICSNRYRKSSFDELKLGSIIKFENKVDIEYLSICNEELNHKSLKLQCYDSEFYDRFKKYYYYVDHDFPHKKSVHLEHQRARTC